MLLKLLTIITIFCNEGVLRSYENNQNFILNCPDITNKTCFFEMDIPKGHYMYISDDKKDTSVILVTNTDVFLYKYSENFTLVK
jgi:hypothetical protein